MTIISFDRAVGYYDETRGFLPGVAEQVRDAIVAFTGATAATRFMELGIGTGRIAFPFLEAGYEYDGTDISAAMMAKLEDKLADLAVRQNKPRSAIRCVLTQANLADPLPFENASYDVLIAIHVFHLIQNWQHALRESKRILKPNGWLLISTDSRPAKPAEDEKRPDDTEFTVTMRWHKILGELGVDRQTLRPFSRASDGELSAYLQTLGARTEIVELLTYNQPPLSPRQIAERLKARMYSSDWYLPDDIHEQASKRLDEWLNSECPNPDEVTQTQDTFNVLAASWGK